MRIAVCSISYPPLISGVSTVAASLAQAMVKKGHQVFVFTANQKFKFQLVNKGNLKEIRFPSVKSPLRKDVFIPIVNLTKIKQLTKEFKIQIFHLHSPTHLAKAAIKIAQKKQIPILATHHFMPLFVMSYFKKTTRVIPLSKKLIERGVWQSAIKLYNQLDYITTPTETFRKLLIKNGLKTPCEAISNGIDLTRFKPGSKKKKEYLLYFGRLDQDKNLDILLQSFARSKAKEKIKLVIAGKGALLEKLKELRSKLNLHSQIEFRGFIPENQIVSLYQKAYVYLITSKVEAQSITTLQAVACGLPIIAANAGALPELCHHQKNGFLVPPDDISKTAAVIDILLENKEQMKKFSQESLRIAQKHDIKKTINRYENLYQKIIKRAC